MKLSYLAPSKIPSKAANSVHVMKMCQALGGICKNVDLIVPSYEASGTDPYEYYGVSRNFHIVRRKLYRSILGLLLYSFKVLNVLRRNREQYVYGRDLTSCFLASLFGFNTIWESHAPVEYMGSLYIRLFKIMISRKNYIKTVVISSTLKSYYIERFRMTPNSIVVLADCSDEIDLKKVTPKSIKRDGYKAIVGYIGQLYPGKGMEIISQLVPRCPDVDFHIVGGNEKDVDYWKEKLRTYDNVVFHGYVNPADTPSYGVAMDFLLAPYLNKVQGIGAKDFSQDISKWMSPLKLFEYMSFHKPIISSDLPVLHDVLNNDNSVMCSPDDIDSWVKAIYNIINNPVEAGRIATNAYNDFIGKYTWKKRAERIYDLYMSNQINNI